MLYHQKKWTLPKLASVFKRDMFRNLRGVVSDAVVSLLSYKLGFRGELLT